MFLSEKYSTQNEINLVPTKILVQDKDRQQGVPRLKTHPQCMAHMARKEEEEGYRFWLKAVA
jgi:hypothetical protein